MIDEEIFFDHVDDVDDAVQQEEATVASAQPPTPMLDQPIPDEEPMEE